MTISEFDRLCSKYLIDPSIALENENLRQAIKTNNVAEVERILQEEF